MMVTTKDRLKTAIKLLPKSADAIAGYLGRLGVKGKLSCEEHCVLANYFAAATECQFVTVDGSEAILYESKKHLKDGTVAARAALPEAAKTLVAEFDSGVYPFLIGKMSATAAGDVDYEIESELGVF